MNIARVLAVPLTIAVATGCGEDAKQEVHVKPSSTKPPSIVGRWERQQTCSELVDALGQAGLKSLAPGVIGDFFPGVSPERLARKSNVCSGATPHAHSHFFTRDNQFGSVDDRGQRVDDGTYRVVDGQTLRINEGRFRYRLRGNDTLILTPVISPAARRKALAKPNEFSTAGWQVAVSYTGLAWKRVGCDGWC